MLPLTRNIASLFKPTGIYTRFASTKKIFVGNLPWGARNEDLSSLFGEYGQVVSARVITDRNTGRSRGFGFVEMDDQAAEKAIEGLNGTNFKGRDIRCNEAEAERERPPRQFNNNRFGNDNDRF